VSPKGSELRNLGGIACFPEVILGRVKKLPTKFQEKVKKVLGRYKARTKRVAYVEGLEGKIGGNRRKRARNAYAKVLL